MYSPCMLDQSTQRNEDIFCFACCIYIFFSEPPSISSNSALSKDTESQRQCRKTWYRQPYKAHDWRTEFWAGLEGEPCVKEEVCNTEREAEECTNEMDHQILIFLLEYTNIKVVVISNVITLTYHRGGGEGAKKISAQGGRKGEWRKKCAQHMGGGAGHEHGTYRVLGESPQLHATGVV